MYNPPTSPADDLPAPDHSKRLLSRLIEFGRLLWDMGLNVGPHQMVDLVETLDTIDITRQDDFYNTLKCCLLTRHEQEPLFDLAFSSFWLQHTRPDQRSQPDQRQQQPRRSRHELRLPPSERKRLAEYLNLHDAGQKPGKRPDVERPPHKYDEEEGEDDPGAPEGTAYSAIERLHKKDFAEFTWEEMQEAKRLLAEIRWNPGQRTTRRKVAARQGRYPDMRRILRHNLKYGTELLTLTWRRVKRKPRPLVIICDISGSMSVYSRLLLHFVHTISNGLHNVEAFVFGTRLTRITRQLQKRDVDNAVQDVAKTVQDWSGGTRIGEALRHFNYAWARRVLGHGAVVLLISDGWDRGDPDVLRVEIERLQRNCHRLIWLNPLLDQREYRPLALGMRTALPFIDDFLPAHNLNSLLALGHLLALIDDRKPTRR